MAVMARVCIPPKESSTSDCVMPVSDSSFYLQQEMAKLNSKVGYSGTGDKADLDHYSNHLNPNHSKYASYQSGYPGDKADLNNHSNQLNPNQLNPNNSEYKGHESGYSGAGDKSDLNNHSSQLSPNNSEY